MQTALDNPLVSILFTVAAVGILGWNLQPLESLGVALALMLLCIDQGRMALVDLTNIRQIPLNDPQVERFHTVTLITITLELLGFYLAWMQLGLGTALVLISQLFFNTAAKVQLYPGNLEPIQPFGVKERSPVLIANTVALGLVALWQSNQLRQITAALLLAIVVVYLALKYLAINTAATANGDERP
ncbi:MAG: hypothetical protein AAGA46_14010 [Cyanobacteria bacterium P01_F01_bin.13]